MWTDPDLRKLTERFVIATDEVWRLQTQDDPECLFFQRMAEQGHYGGRPGRTRQGIYVCTPGGKLLSSINSNDPQRVLAMLRRGWHKWQSLPSAQRQLPAAADLRPQHRWEDSYPAEGLVLSMFTRDLPLTCDVQAERCGKWNRDFSWFSSSEARQWLPTEPQLGDHHELPAPLTSRLARFHLVDVARGQTSPFTWDQVAGSRMWTRVLDRQGDRVELEIRGQTESAAPGDKRNLPGLAIDRGDTEHGIHAQLYGRATYDLGQKRFTQFDLVALGTRWGRTRFNGRHGDPESASPIGWVFRLSTATTPRVAPGFVAYYEAPWLQRPR